jgi:hypothetical protein
VVTKDQRQLPGVCMYHPSALLGDHQALALVSICCAAGVVEMGYSLTATPTAGAFPGSGCNGIQSHSPAARKATGWCSLRMHASRCISIDASCTSPERATAHCALSVQEGLLLTTLFCACLLSTCGSSCPLRCNRRWSRCAATSLGQLRSNQRHSRHAGQATSAQHGSPAVCLPVGRAQLGDSWERGREQPCLQVHATGAAPPNSSVWPEKAGYLRCQPAAGWQHGRQDSQRHCCRLFACLKATDIVAQTGQGHVRRRQPAGAGVRAQCLRMWTSLRRNPGVCNVPAGSAREHVRCIHLVLRPGFASQAHRVPASHNYCRGTAAVRMRQAANPQCPRPGDTREGCHRLLWVLLQTCAVSLEALG